jgi:hypothetical protein
MRVMVEGQDAIVVDEIAEHLAAVVRDAVNEKLDNENDAGQAA